MTSVRSRSTYAAALLATVATAFSMLVPVAAHAQNIAVVNNKPIPKVKADTIVAQMVKQGQQDTPELQKAIREDLITREILMQEAEKKGVASDPDVQAQIDRARQQVLIGALAQDYFKANPPTDAEVHQQYDLLVKDVGGKEYKARHILVEKEADAKAIIAKLKAGARFEDLAKQSKDPGSAANGGDLDWAAGDDVHDRADDQPRRLAAQDVAGPLDRCHRRRQTHRAVRAHNPGDR